MRNVFLHRVILYVNLWLKDRDENQVRKEKNKKAETKGIWFIYIY